MLLNVEYTKTCPSCEKVHTGTTGGKYCSHRCFVASTYPKSDRNDRCRSSVARNTTVGVQNGAASVIGVGTPLIHGSEINVVRRDAGWVDRSLPSLTLG